MQKNNSIQNSQVEAITNKVWPLIDILRNEQLSYNEYTFVLFLLSIYKDGYLDEIQIANKHNLITLINNKINNPKIVNSDQYVEIYKAYYNLIEKISNIGILKIIELLKSIDSNLLEQNFAAIFDNILYYLSKINRQISGENIQPTELTLFIYNLIEIPKNSIVFNPFAGIASFGVTLEKNQLYIGQEINLSTWAIGKLRLLAYNKSDFSNFIQGDSINNWDSSLNGKFDLIISTPPFGLRLNSIYNNDFISNARTAEEFLLIKGIESIKSDGKLVMVSTKGLLNQVGQSLDIRKNLIENDYLEMVILLPSGIFYTSAISSAILILNKNKKTKNTVTFVNGESFFFIDGSQKQKKLKVKELLGIINDKKESEFVQIISNIEISKNNFNFNPISYLIDTVTIPEGYKVIALKDVINQKSRHSNLNEILGRYIQISDLANDSFDYKKSYSEKELTELNKNAIKLTENSLLISRIALRLKPTYYFYNKDIPVYINPNIWAFTVNEDLIDIDYLIHELNSELFQKQLSAYSTGSVISSINLTYFLNLIILLPSLSEQKRITVAKKTEFILSEQEKLNKLKANFQINVADENSFLRHQIAGKLRNVRSSFKRVQEIIEKNISGKIEDVYEFKSREMDKLNLGNHLQIIERDLFSIYNATNKAGKEIDFTELKITRIDIIQFVKDFSDELKERQNKLFKIKLNTSEDDLIPDGISHVFINADADLIRKMFDNLIENAEKHAFNNSFSIKNEIDIDFLFDFDDLELQLDFSNNGSPFPSNLSFENAIRKGSKAGQNSGDGIGLWYINEIMKIHGGRLEFTDETGSEGIGGDLASTFELIFPIEIEKKDDEI